MSFPLLLLLLALASMGVLAWFRLRRMRTHGEPIEGWRRIAFVLLFVLVPPVLLQVQFAPKTGPGAVDVVGAVVLYVLIVVALAALGFVAAQLIARFAPVESRPKLLMALIGRDTSGIVPFDPPMTPRLAADVERVTALNATFPRGITFLGQIPLPGFRSSWDALDEATQRLESDIEEQRRLGLRISEQALATANDARGRLDTLHREAANAGLWSTT